MPVLVMAGKLLPAKTQEGRQGGRGARNEDETNLACTGCRRQEFYKPASILDATTPSIAVLLILRCTFHVSSTSQEFEKLAGRPFVVCFFNADAPMTALPDTVRLWQGPAQLFHYEETYYPGLFSNKFNIKCNIL